MACTGGGARNSISTPLGICSGKLVGGAINSKSSAEGISSGIVGGGREDGGWTTDDEGSDGIGNGSCFSNGGGAADGWDKVGATISVVRRPSSVGSLPRAESRGRSPTSSTAR